MTRNKKCRLFRERHFLNQNQLILFRNFQSENFKIIRPLTILHSPTFPSKLFFLVMLLLETLIQQR